MYLKNHISTSAVFMSFPRPNMGTWYTINMVHYNNRGLCIAKQEGLINDKMLLYALLVITYLVSL